MTPNKNTIKIKLSKTMENQIKSIAKKEHVDEEYVLLELISEGICRRINNSLVLNQQKVPSPRKFSNKHGEINGNV